MSDDKPKKISYHKHYATMMSGDKYLSFTILRFDYINAYQYCMQALDKLTEYHIVWEKECLEGLDIESYSFCVNGDTYRWVWDYMLLDNTIVLPKENISDDEERKATKFVQDLCDMLNSLVDLGDITPMIAYEIHRI